MRLPLSPQVADQNSERADPTGWSLQDIRAPGTTLVWLHQFDVSLNPVIWFPLPLPEEGSIQRVSAHVAGRNLGALPSGLPMLELFEQPVFTSNAARFEQVDLTSTLEAYATSHVIALTTDSFGGQPLPIRTDASYWIRITGEHGDNAEDNRLKLLAVNLTLSPT
ncbi:MAG TPA: hypothetical protein VJN18_01850 [Polyangiaceae bacterium]|nr:hypothetical protein [Polyangiaceae bacterium]